MAALGAGLYCQGGDTAPATVTHTFDWKCDCFLIPVLLIMLCANESGAPGVFQLLPGSQEPDPHNKIVQSQCRGRDQRVTLYCCSRQWRSSYPTTCYFHLLSGPFKSVFLQYITSTISQYKPRPWRYCHQFTTTLTTTLFIKQCAVNVECYHCTNLTQ